MIRLPAVATALAAAALAMTGCVTIKDQSQSQLSTIGDVRVVTTLCQSSESGTCPMNDSNYTYAAEDRDVQLLVAYRVPNAVDPPQQVLAKYTTLETGSTLLTRSPSLSSEMQADAPAIAGEKWVGYVSPLVPVADQREDAQFTLTADFGLGRPASGAPFEGPFRYRVAVGVRTANATNTGDPVQCWEDVTIENIETPPGPNHRTVCADAPFGPESTLETDDQMLATRDLGVLHGARGSAVAGRTASIPFKIRSVGMNGGPVFDLRAGTTIPGGTATPSESVFAPTPSEGTVPVSVQVPRDTPPGTYGVTLSAALGSAQARTGRGTITVTAPPVTPRPPKPRLSLSISKRKLRTALKKGLKVRVGCDRACTIKLRLGSLGGGTGRLGAAGKRTVVAKFKRSARRKLKNRRSLRFKLRVSAKGANGRTAVRTRRVKLTR